MKDISEITKQTISNLANSNIDATPDAYEKEFCRISNNIKFNTKECEYFKDVVSKLSIDEVRQTKNNKVETTHQLIDILLQRVEKKNIDKMSNLLNQSMTPSISLSIDKELHSFSIKIGESPSLIFEESIQQEIEKFIEKRFEVDKKVVAKKTADIARLITLMSKYLGDAIDSNQQGGSTVTEIKKEITSIGITGSTKEELNKLQSKLVQAAISIENEMQSVNSNLQSGRDEVSILEEKVKSLENELQATKAKSTKDHLTGTLIRSAYEDEIKKFDEKFKRLGTDFAIIFFDIDHFKKVNDTYGHEGGDVILKTFASLILKLTRDIDIVGRYGGEEFVVAVHYKDINELEKYVTRIKNVVTKNKFLFKEHKVAITFSAGIDLRSNNKTMNDTVSSADKLLYKAKHSGRDKIIFWNNKEI
ncbi:MAG: diguanylate cyclase [Campylobacterota bacterium]|nr:diguanylate cyclase [Campylobacterota bacterium]